MRIPLPVKLMASYLVVAAIIVLPSALYLEDSLLSALERSEVSSLEAGALALRERIEPKSGAELDETVRAFAHVMQARITVIDADGRVAADSDLTPEQVELAENHGTRPEVLGALGGAFAHDVRVSATTGAEMLYGAVPLGEGRVLRVSTHTSAIHSAVRHALLGLRLGSGIGVSAALLLSLIAALFVSSPLRRMRDAARSFSRGDWVNLKRIKTGDEIEELSTALQGLGQRLRAQLVDVGTQEALLCQAVRALPLPLVVLDGDLLPLEASSTLRRFAELTPSEEADALMTLARSPAFLSACETARATARPVATRLELGTSRDAWVLCLERASAPPFWLVALSGELLLPSANETSVPVEVHAVEELVRQSIAAVLLEYPGARLSLKTLACEAKIADAAGQGGRALRTFLGDALAALPAEQRLAVSVETEASHVRVVVSGAAPLDLEPTLNAARLMGADAGCDPRDEESAWLRLPRA